MKEMAQWKVCTRCGGGTRLQCVPRQSSGVGQIFLVASCSSAKMPLTPPPDNSQLSQPAPSD